MAADSFRCLLVTKEADGKFKLAVTERSLGDLPAGDVLIDVRYSSLNYKDALSAAGHPGVTRKFPHVLGIDASGVVLESKSPDLRPGDEVLVTGFDQGQNTWGGFAERIRVPAGWVVKLPRGMSLRDAMIYGTAGFTAALCVAALECAEVPPTSGPVLVTGASGGVGCVAVAILAKLGYHVTAVSGKPASRDWLKKLGAAEVIDRAEVTDASNKPMLAERWAGAVDTVGGSMLSTVVRTLKRNGCAAACGLVGGTDLPLTVYPFILRNVTLAGIDSVECAMPLRLATWEKLAGPWRPAKLDELVAATASLDEMPEWIEKIRGGHVAGRLLVEPGLRR
ncbi:MAG: YhdH/YhfP family quinone oxidoreductase [Planctomycetes bacterium]|nr:YhdH/YhfP family quinone oxidoreductase [Planctomycetota bacterium]